MFKKTKLLFVIFMCFVSCIFSGCSTKFDKTAFLHQDAIISNFLFNDYNFINEDTSPMKKNNYEKTQNKNFKKSIVISQKNEIYDPETCDHIYDGIICRKCYSWISVNDNQNVILLNSYIAKENNISLTGNVIIPEIVVHNGKKYKVGGIGYNVFISSGLFKDNKDVISVTLPDSCKYIQPFAFDNCSNLRHIYLNNGLIYIGDAAFQLCSGLEEINIPDSVEFIGDFAFNHCVSLKNTSIKLPSALLSLGKHYHYPAHMFYDCGTDNFSSFVINHNTKYTTNNGILYTGDMKTLVNIPNGVKFTNSVYNMPDSIINLGELSFSRNKNIDTVIISDNLIVDDSLTDEEKNTYLNYGNDLSRACYGYSSVSKYETKETNQKYTSVNGILYSKDMLQLVAIPNNYSGEIVVPEGVTTWNNQALWTDMIDYFSGISINKITKIVIPSSMISISENQIEGINKISELYGTIIEVSSENPNFTVENNKLILTS